MVTTDPREPESGTRSPSPSSDATHTDKAAFVKDEETGLKYINQYQFVKTLGQGAFGKVKLATSGDQKFAIKIIRRSLLKARKLGRGRTVSLLDNILREIAIMKKLDHPNCVKLYEIIDDPDHEKMYLVLEFIEGGAIMEGMEADPLSPDLARSYFRQLIQGLLYLHEVNVVHRDLKPENLLVGSDGILKIADYGVSRITEAGDDTLEKTDGTPAFFAPEQCTPGSYRGEPADVWAAGVCLYMFVCGVVPFRAPSYPEILQKIKNDDLTFPEGFDTTENQPIICLIRKVLNKDPEERARLPDLFDDEWVTNRGAQRLVRTATQAIDPTQEEIDHAVTEVNSMRVIANIAIKMKKFKKKVDEKKKDESAVGVDNVEFAVSDTSDTSTAAEEVVAAAAAAAASPEVTPLEPTPTPASTPSVPPRAVSPRTVQSKPQRSKSIFHSWSKAISGSFRRMSVSLGFTSADAEPASTPDTAVPHRGAAAASAAQPQKRKSLWEGLFGSKKSEFSSI
eukprot:Rmarinus@m.13495